MTLRAMLGAAGARLSEVLELRETAARDADVLVMHALVWGAPNDSCGRNGC